MKKEIKDSIYAKVNDIGYHLYDIEEEKNSNNHVIRLLVQKSDLSSVDLDDCVTISHNVGDFLDEFDSLVDEYLLEVCSPGIIKSLKVPDHFKQHIGEEIEIKTFKILDGFESKQVVGLLEGVTDEFIILNGVNIEYKDLAKANNKYEF